MKDEILEKLKNTQGYISGQQLCNDFGVSRTAVWKAINRLKNEGYEIDSVTNKGYRLKSCPELFSSDEIKKHLKTKYLAKEVVFYDKTGSTNNDAAAYMRERNASGILVAASSQTEGKGRRGRAWESEKDSSVSFSLGLRPELEVSKISMLTLVMALAVQQAVEKVTDLHTQIKWPNDIVINGKKICGILTEMNMEMEYVTSVVIGVGINTGQKTFPDELKEKATSLYLEMNKGNMQSEDTKRQMPSRSLLTAECVNCFEKLYKKVKDAGDLTPIKKEYEEKLVNSGRKVTVLDPAGEYTGTAKGITDLGELTVIREDGREESVYAGEVSVRGVYGYT